MCIKRIIFLNVEILHVVNLLQKHCSWLHCDFTLLAVLRQLKFTVYHSVIVHSCNVHPSFFMLRQCALLQFQSTRDHTKATTVSARFLPVRSDGFVVVVKAPRSTSTPSSVHESTSPGRRRCKCPGRERTLLWQKIAKNWKRWQLRMHCNLKGAWRRSSRSGLFHFYCAWALFTDCYLPASNQNSDTPSDSATTVY